MFHCAIIYQNIDKGIEYFLEKVPNFDISAETTSHEFRLNVTQDFCQKYFAPTVSSRLKICIILQYILVISLKVVAP